MRNLLPEIVLALEKAIEGLSGNLALVSFEKPPLLFVVVTGNWPRTEIQHDRLARSHESVNLFYGSGR
jgi:hypothetical protein